MMEGRHKQTGQPVYAYRNLYSDQRRWIVEGDGLLKTFPTFVDAEKFLRSFCYDWVAGLVISG